MPIDGDVEPAISVVNVGKKYRLTRAHGDQEYASLRVALTEALWAPWRMVTHGKRQRRAEFWALKDVSFDVFPGEVVGIIGRNGAGKSTLLKILGQITWPTDGHARIRGRVASLLEVGTGFHPELTGRENVLLNGAILGMRRTEILRRFDEIVEFAEVSAFIDTPVKRYSSGMYLRLAFSVAAHLDPEILLVDEVLAVGDAQFQRRCLNKMREVVKASRTVLFVSHNMQAVQSLCSRVVLLENGRVAYGGGAEDTIARYLSSGSKGRAETSWTPETAPGDREFKLLGVVMSGDDSEGGTLFRSSRDIRVSLRFATTSTDAALCVGFDLMTPDGTTVLTTYQTDQSEDSWPALQFGLNTFTCVLPGGLLNSGEYFISPRVRLHTTSLWKVREDAVLGFEVVLDHGVSPVWNSQAKHRAGKVAPILRWYRP